jgi:AAA15 family ATPase/GTPase
VLGELWNTIFVLSKQLNVQVFATTHSKECIESFNRVQKNLEDDQSFYFEMASCLDNTKIVFHNSPNTL